MKVFISQLAHQDILKEVQMLGNKRVTRFSFSMQNPGIQKKNKLPGKFNNLNIQIIQQSNCSKKKKKKRLKKITVF